MAATLLPDEVAGSVERFEGALTELESSLEPVLRGLTPGRNAYSHLAPLERAKLHVTLAFAANTLFNMYLKTQGVSTADHPVKRELERVQMYLKKVEKAEHAGELPTASLNVQATNRFITHAIPDLTEAQRSGLRAINKRERDKQSGAAPAEGSTPAKKRSAKEAAAEAASFLDALDSEQVVPEAGGKKKKKKGSS